MSTTAVNVAGLDGGSKAITLRADQNSDNSLAMRASLEIGGAAVGAGNAVPTIGAGSTGTDYSANAAAVPINGYALLATVPVTPSRAAVEVQNQSAALIQIVLDDGAGNNQSSILLAAGAGAGQQGGDWSSLTFKGRVRVYGATGSQVLVRAD